MKTRQDIITRAVEDQSFREQLTADPRGPLDRELDGGVPGNVRITVLQETPDQVYLVLPAHASKELTADELAGAAGGSCYFVTSVSSIA